MPNAEVLADALRAFPRLLGIPTTTVSYFFSGHETTMAQSYILIVMRFHSSDGMQLQNRHVVSLWNVHSWTHACMPRHYLHMRAQNAPHPSTRLLMSGRFSRLRSRIAPRGYFNSPQHRRWSSSTGTSLTTTATLSLARSTRMYHLLSRNLTVNSEPCSRSLASSNAPEASGNMICQLSERTDNYI